MRGKFFAIVVTVFIMVFGISGFVYFYYFYGETKTVHKVKKTDDGEQIEEVHAEVEVELHKELNPFGEPISKEDLEDLDVIDYIHAMSHQKVKASEKWGFFRITDERINWLLDAVRESDSLGNSDTYLEILERWEKGDFSKVDKDHNAVWILRGGNRGGAIGEAYGILSEEEEKAFNEGRKESRRDKGF